MLSRIISLLLLGLMLSGCQAGTASPLVTIDRMELPRFMGDWYVIGTIPTILDKDAYNAVETYRMEDSGTIATTFSFNSGGFDGELNRYHFASYIKDKESNAVWGMQILWPFKAEYRVIYLAPDYSVTIIGRSKRDYVWIMARDPGLTDSEYEWLAGLVADAGYDVRKLYRVPHRWQKAST